MKRFLALISVTAMLCMLLTGCTKGGNVSNEPNGSITSDPNDRNTEAASELMPGTTHRNDSESSTAQSGSTEHSENTNGSNGNGTSGTNNNGTHNGTNGSDNTENTENSTGAPQSRGFRRF